MRHSIKRISKSALSVILALMMVVSTMAVGMVSTSAANGTITVYFKNTVNWDSVYAYFYNGSYWNDTQGSGSMNIAGGPTKMKPVSGTTDIYYCTYTGNYTGVISFTKDYQPNYNNFNNTQAVYRSDFTVSTPLFTPDTTSSKKLNNTVYYNNGNWSAYSGGTSGGETTLGTAPDVVLNRTSVMFYIASYTGTGTLGLNKYDNSACIGVDKVLSTKDVYTGYITLPTSEQNDYYYITNNGTSWNNGIKAEKIKEATGGEYFKGNSNPYSFVPATTGETSLSSASANLGSTTPITLTTVSDKTKSSYETDLYVQYYVDKTLVNTDNLAASTSGASYDLDVSDYAAGPHTIQTVLTDGKVYYISDTDTFTIASKTTLATPTVTLTSNGVSSSTKGTITSEKSITLNISSSGADYPENDETLKFELINSSSGATVKTLSLGDNTLSFADNIDDGNYTVKVSADEATYNPASSAEFALESVQLYEFTIQDDGDSDVTVSGTYLDAYGSSQNVEEGQTVLVPENGEVTVTANITAANKEFTKFTYNGTEYTANNAKIPVTAKGTLTTTVETVTMQTIKIAAVSYIDPSGTNDNRLSSNPTVSYTAGTKTDTVPMTKTDDEVYFYISGTWTNAQIYYVYTVSVPSNTTKIKIDNKGSDITLDASKDYYAFYNYGGWKSTPLTESDRYYPVKILADTTFDKGATVDSSVDADVNKKNLDNTSPTKTVYKYGTSITLEATPSNASAFSLERWSDGTSVITSPYTVVGEATLTAYFKANQTYAINLVTTVANLLSITSSPATATYESNTVKVTVTADAGYECTGLTVTGDSISTSVDVTKNDDGTYSFKMPGENVTVTPTITARKVATVNVTSSDETLGTAVLSTTGTIYVGDSFTVNATPLDDYVFESFSVTGADQIATVKNDDGSTTGTFKSNAQNVSVTANFTENSGVLCNDKFIVYGTKQNPNEWGISNGTQYLDVYYNSTDNAYYATIPYNVFSGVSNLYFALSSSTTDINQLWWRTNVPNTKNIIVSEDDPNSAIKAVRSEWNNYKDNNNGQFVQLSEISDTVTAVKVKIVISTVDGATDNQGTYTITPVLETVPEGTARVYAKDGTTGATYQYGDTKVLANGDTVKLKNEYDKYNVYSAQKDSYLTVQTTMDETYSGYGYYVYAFCINGESYPAVAKKGGVYETTYKVTGEEVHNAVEITPVYYNKKVEEAGEYITVYVDASKLGNHWGNTISCYSYYYTGTISDGKPVAHETTKYPGQPMLMGSNGLYYTRVPRYAYSNGTKIEKTTGGYYPISGVTLNSFIENGELHGTIYPEIGTNYQTYDYDDFKYIADLGFDTVKFEIQYKTGTTNRSTLLSNATDHPNKSDSTINISDYEVSNEHNGWDNLYDFDGNIIGILGEKLEPAEQAQPPIYVVSTGNQNTSMGQWSTVWYVYKYDENSKQYTYVTQGLPSDFIPRIKNEEGTATNQPAYNDIVSNRLENVPVKICYESEQGADGNTGVRIDGRWYYTTSKQETPVDVTVQYRTSKDSAWIKDTDNVSGTATIDGVTSKTFTERNVTAKLDAVAKSGYVFVEWGIVDDNGENYTKLSNVKSASSEFMIDTSYHLVACFEKVEDGSLVISHDKYTGSEPPYVGGGGYYLVSAEVKDSDGAVKTTYDLTEGSITIPGLASLTGCTIDITMVTRMKGENTFIDWYMRTPEGDYDNITQSESAWGKTGEVSQKITVDVDVLYDGGTLLVNTLQFYSDIALVTKDAVLNYKYYNRFNEERTYTVTVTLDDNYIQTNGYEITDQLIYDNAPAIKDLYKNCIWTITAQTTTRNGTTATLWGTHNEAKKDVILNYGKLSEPIDTVYQSVTYNEYLLTDSDEFYIAPAEGLDSDNNKADFAYWIVIDTATGKEVARCYSRDFNLRIVDDYTVTAIYSNKKEDVVTISDPKFTREQFTDPSGKVVTDYLYADFIVAYMGAENVLLNSEAGKNYHTGLIVEYGKDTKIHVDSSIDDTVGSTYDGALTEYNGFTAEQIKDIALDSSMTHESFTTVNNGNGLFAAHKFEINNSSYNNFNRLDYYVQFNNTKNIRHYIMKAYYYVYVTDDKGNVIDGSYKVTEEPVYFCYYNIGNSDTKTGE